MHPVVGRQLSAALAAVCCTEALMRRYKCKHRTASEYATKAREIGLLPPTEPGKVTVNKPKARKGSK